ncbi:hypothetical protein ABC347_12855 [Sphingomonas sp. 1P06PA]|uniref:hypothetical protein n=1 Tax=Sphingomonas sp. 1P06PA TaxID=554121 RepID=UPI0039A56E98
MIRLDRRFWLLLALLWAAAAFCYWWVARGELSAFELPDPDDQLRLQQVRDLIAGQSWFDLTQYRINSPDGVAMHWSRIVDVPIAAVMLLARPVVGAAAAETAALVIVPLLTLAAAMAAAALLTSRLDRRPIAIFATLALAPLTNGALAQMQVMRIDHHGWQIVLTLLAAAMMLDPRPRRSGAATGIACALLLHISLEGLPMTAAIGAVLGLRWLVRPATEVQRFRWFASVLAGASLLGFVLLRPASAWATILCDVITPVHLAMLAAGAVGVLIATEFTTARSMIWRAAALAATGLVAAALYPLIAPQCVTGAFSALDPIVRTFWYLRIEEGLPLSWSNPVVLVGMVAFPAIALAGAINALRLAPADQRLDWISYLILLAVATLLATQVARTGGTATMLALPGAVAAALALARLASRFRSPILRVPAITLAMIAILPITPPLVTVLASRFIAPSVRERKQTLCGTDANYRRLRALPPAILLADLDISPGILIATHHRMIASGHHRNLQGIRDTLVTMMAPIATARTVIARRHVDYVVLCTDLAETHAYRKQAPQGLAARLSRGEAIDWLQPVALPGARIKVWRVLR